MSISRTPISTPCYQCSISYGITVEDIKSKFADFVWRMRTDEVRKRLKALNPSLTLYGKKNCDFREFLVDFVLYGKLSPGAQSGYVALAVESELSSKEPCWDFDKLLHVKSPVKMLIHKHGQLMDVKRKIEEYLRDYCQHVEGEHYIFLLSDGSPKPKFLEYRCKTNGRNPDANIENA